MQFKLIVDKDGAEVKMAGWMGADGVFRPVHHSGLLTLQSSLTRPADATPYTAGDIVGGIGATVLHTFDLGAANLPGGGLIVGARLVRNVVTNPGVRFRAVIHDAAPASAPLADNAASPLLWANRASRRGWIDFSGVITGFGAGTDCNEIAGVLSHQQGIVVTPADGIVRVSLVTLDAFTPAASEVSLIELDLVV